MAFRFTPRRALALVGVVAVTGGALDYVTRPPPLPDYAAVRSRWHPSEAWLYDRHGTLIDSARVDFAVRRLAWTPLAAICLLYTSPSPRDGLLSRMPSSA